MSKSGNNKLYLLNCLMNLRYMENSSILTRVLGGISGFNYERCSFLSYGHIQKYYFKWKKENKDKKGKQRENDHDDDDRVTTTTTKGGDLVLLCNFKLVNLISDESMWIVDSGATLHVTPRKEFFIFYTSGDFELLKMGKVGCRNRNRDGTTNQKNKICKNRVWSRHHSYYRKLWKTIKKKQGL